MRLNRHGKFAGAFFPAFLAVALLNPAAAPAGRGRVPPLEGPSIRADFSPPFIEQWLYEPPAGVRKAVIPRIEVDWPGSAPESAWSRAAELGPTTRPGETLFQAFYNDRGLFIRARCRFNPGNPPVAVPRPRNRPAWDEDMIEIRLRLPDAPGQPENPQFHFVVTAANTVYDSRGGDSGYDAHWESETEIGPDAWTLRVMIPFEALEITGPPRQLEINLGRNGPAHALISWGGSWAGTSDRRIILDGVTETAAPAGTAPPRPAAAHTGIASGSGIALDWETGRARAHDRWVRGRVLLDPETLSPGDRVEMNLYGPGSGTALESVSFSPGRAEGRVSVDLRRHGLESARLEARLSRDGRTLGTAESFLAADPLPGEYPPGFRVPLLVDLPEGPALDGPWPLTAGVPFPPGALWEPSGWLVEDAQGNAFPARFEVTATWAPDGPVKWLRVDTVADPARQLFLARRPGTPAPEPDSPVTVERNGDIFLVSSAGSTWEIGGDLSPVRLMRRGGQTLAEARNTRGLYLVDNRGRLAVASGEGAEARLEAAGPVAACVRLEGDYRVVSGGEDHGEAVARHITRVEVYAGHPFARVTHTLVITRDTNETWFREAGWELDAFPGPGARAFFAVSRDDAGAVEVVEAPGPDEEVFLLQESYFRFGQGEKRFVLSRPGQEAAPGGEMGDWFMLAGEDGGLMISCRESARQHPKEFSVSGGRMNLKLFSGRAGEELDFRAPALVRKWNLDDWYGRLYGEERAGEMVEKALEIHSDATGWAKTHEILLAPAPAGAREAAALSRRHSRPVFTLADPEWIYRSRAMGPLHPRDPENFPAAERLVDAALSFYASRVPSFGLWGFVDYFAGPTLNHLHEDRPPMPWRWNMTYTLRPDLWRVFARSGTREAFEFATATNRAVADNYLASWSGRSRVRGLFVTAGGSDTNIPTPRNLPFYWGSGSSTNWHHNTNLDQFLWDYHLTGWRRAADQVRDYAAAAREHWAPSMRAHDFYIFTTFRALMQSYAFTWDPDLRALADDIIDFVEDTEGEIDLTKEGRPYRSSTYKSNTDPIRALLEARDIFGGPRYERLLRKMAEHLWRGHLGGENITYTNSKGIVGQYLWEETGNPEIALELLVALRRASAELDRDAAGHGIRIGAHASSFIFEGIPAIQDVLARAGDDPQRDASWAAARDFDYPVEFAFLKGDMDTVGLYLKSPHPGELSVGGPRMELVNPASTFGPEVMSGLQYRDFTRWTAPRDLPAGAARVIPAAPGIHHLVARGASGLVVHAPEYWVPWPPQEPPVRWFFRVPEGSEEPAIFFEGRAVLQAPSGDAWHETGDRPEWVPLPPEMPGLWAFVPLEARLVRVRNLPPFFAAENPGAWFDPGLAREPGPEKPAPVPLPGGPVFTEGVSGGGLYIRPGSSFSFEGGEELEGGLGSRFLPFHEGTVEFWMRPIDWDTFNMPGDPRAGSVLKRIMQMPTDDPADLWFLNYEMDYTTTHDFRTHTLCFQSRADNGRRMLFRNFRKFTVFEPGKWVHLALTWGPRVRGTVHGPRETLVMNIYLNGRAGVRHREGALLESLPTGRPLRLVFPGLGGVISQLRVSDIIRYEEDFEPAAAPPAPDDRTRAWFSFDGTLDGVSGDGSRIAGELR